MSSRAPFIETVIFAGATVAALAPNADAGIQNVSPLEQPTPMVATIPADYPQAESGSASQEAAQPRSENVSSTSAKLARFICADHSYGPGSRGHCVRDIQTIISNHVTGYYDGQTMRNVKTFQRNRGLRVSGTTDKRTWVAVCREAIGYGPEPSSIAAARDAGCFSLKLAADVGSKLSNTLDVEAPVAEFVSNELGGSTKAGNVEATIARKRFEFVYRCVQHYFRFGNRDRNTKGPNCVHDIQAVVGNGGDFPGSYELGTRARVKAFQAANGLNQSGIFGPREWKLDCYNLDGQPGGWRQALDAGCYKGNFGKSEQSNSTASAPVAKVTFSRA